ALAASKGATVSQLALAWLLTRGEHIVPIPGTRSAKRVEENTGAADVTLTEADLAAIGEALPHGGFGARYPEFATPDWICLLSRQHRAPGSTDESVTAPTSANRKSIMKQTIVITGASDGIGAAAARQLAAKGHEVVLVGRSPAKTKAVAQELGARYY